MKKAFITAAALALSLAAPSAFAADKAFECPWSPIAGETAAVKGVQESFGKQDPLDEPEALNAAVDQLRKAGANRAIIIDNLISAYCPVVAGNANLSTAQKTTRVQRFATAVVPLVYSIESADQIILEVALPPDVVDSINARAQAAKITPEEWVAGAAERAVTAK